MLIDREKNITVGWSIISTDIEEAGHKLRGLKGIKSPELTAPNQNMADSSDTFISKVKTMYV